MGMCDTCGNVFRCLILAGIAGALTLQFFTMFSCEFVEFSDTSASAGLWFLGKDGICLEDQYETDDGVVAGARSALTISMIAGFAAGVMIAFEWLLCEVCCAGCLEGLCIAAAWIVGGSTFMFYGSDFCLSASVDDAFSEITEEDITCDYGSASSLLSTACFLYLCCGVLLCCTPQPDPICKQGR